MPIARSVTCRWGRELLETGELHVSQPIVQELMAIRRGERQYSSWQFD